MKYTYQTYYETGRTGRTRHYKNFARKATAVKFARAASRKTGGFVQVVRKPGGDVAVMCTRGKCELYG